MRGIVKTFSNGTGTIGVRDPRDAGGDITFSYRDIQTNPKTLAAGDEVKVELASPISARVASTIFRS